MVITSKDNPKVKYLTSLHKSSVARSEGVIFVEGARICKDAALSGAKIKSVIMSENFKDEERFFTDLSEDQIILSDNLFKKISSTVNPQGIALVIRRPDTGSELPFRGNGKDIYAVLEDVQDPGNIGTIIRTADAFDFTAVLMSDSSADPFGEKAIRSSMGSIWHLPVIRMPMDDIISFLKSKDIARLAMHLKGDSLNEADIKLPCAYFIGNEGKGLTDKTSSECDRLIRIDMQGKAESLNAAASSAIIGYVLSTIRHNT